MNKIFVGRNKQLEQVSQLIQQTFRGESRVCLIQGAAGIGKTRLLKEIEALAELNGLTFLQGRCFEDLT